MAGKTKKEKTEEEVPVTLESINADLQAFKEEVMARLPMQPLVPVHAILPSTDPEDVKIPDTPAENDITFIFHDRFKEPRTFNQSDNGPEWRDLANSFHENNSAQIKKRIDK